jgi:hypothetical protein
LWTTRQIRSNALPASTGLTTTAAREGFAMAVHAMVKVSSIPVRNFRRDAKDCLSLRETGFRWVLSTMHFSLDLTCSCVLSGFEDSQDCSRCFTECPTTFSSTPAPTSSSSSTTAGPTTTSTTVAPSTTMPATTTCLCATCPACVCTTAPFVNECTPAPSTSTSSKVATSSSTDAPTTSQRPSTTSSTTTPPPVTTSQRPSTSSTTPPPVTTSQQPSTTSSTPPPVTTSASATSEPSTTTPTPASSTSSLPGGNSTTTNLTVGQGTGSNASNFTETWAPFNGTATAAAPTTMPIPSSTPSATEQVMLAHAYHSFVATISSLHACMRFFLPDSDALQ